MSEAEQRFIFLVNEAVALQKRGELSRAVANYREALTIAPGHPVVLSNLGNALRRQGALEEALACQRTAVAADGRNGWFLANLALAEEATGLDMRPTCRRVVNEPLTDEAIRIWAALKLDEPETAFAFRPKKQNLLPYDALPALYRSAGLAADLAALPPLSGSRPALEGPTVVFASADGVYASMFADNLIASALRNSGLAVHFHVMNPGAFDPASAFQAFPEERLSWTVEHNVPPSKIFYASRRWLRLSQIQHDIDRTFISVDADCTINGDLQNALAPDSDVTLLMRDGEIYANQMINAALFACAPRGRDFLAFLAAWLLHFEKRGETKWFDDQMNLLQAWAWFPRNVPGLTIRTWAADTVNDTGSAAHTALVSHYKGPLKMKEPV